MLPLTSACQNTENALVRNGSLQPFCKLLKFCSTSILNVIHPARQLRRVASLFTTELKCFHETNKSIFSPISEKPTWVIPFMVRKIMNANSQKGYPQSFRFRAWPGFHNNRKETDCSKRSRRKKIDIFQQLSTASNTSSSVAQLVSHSTQLTQTTLLQAHVASGVSK